MTTEPSQTLDATPSPAWEEEWDALTSALNRWGVIHVAPGRQSRTAPPALPRELFDRLFRTAEPRLHQATVVLLLTHPHLAPDAQTAIAALDGAAHDRAMRRYVAAAALQRMARTRIARSLGPRPLLPPAYLDDLDLPPLDEEFGRTALVALAKAERDRYGYDAWGTYKALLDHFLADIRRRDWGKPCDNAPTARS